MQQRLQASTVLSSHSKLPLLPPQPQARATVVPPQPAAVALPLQKATQEEEVRNPLAVHRNRHLD